MLLLEASEAPASSWSFWLPMLDQLGTHRGMQAGLWAGLSPVVALAPCPGGQGWDGDAQKPKGLFLLGIINSP